MEFKGLRAQYAALRDKLDPAMLSSLSAAEYILGPEVDELERILAGYVGRKHCVACGNGTDALILAMLTRNIGPGDGVLMPAFTCFAPAAAVLARGAVPILVDIDPATFNMSPGSLESAISVCLSEGGLQPKAVIAIDLFGLPAAFPEISEIAARHGLVLIEDAAQGFGGSLRDSMACSLGDTSITSFYPGKPLSCAGDGGAVFTDSEQEAAALRSVRALGRSEEDRYVNPRAGVNSRLDTLQAVLLLEKFKAFRALELPKVNSIAGIYSDALGSLIRVPEVPEGYYSSWAQYTVRLEDQPARDRLVAHLSRNGVPSVVHYPVPLNLQGALRGRFRQPVSLDESAKAAACALSLPIHAYLEESEVDAVIEAVTSFFA